MAKLNDRQRRFAEFVVSGIAPGRAYERAGFKARGHSADSCATKLLSNAVVSKYVDQLRSEARATAVINVRERMEYLSLAITTPIGEVDQTSALCAEFTSDEIGEAVIRTRIKKVDPLRALDLLNKMDGAYTPERHEVETTNSLTELLKRI